MVQREPCPQQSPEALSSPSRPSSEVHTWICFFFPVSVVPFFGFKLGKLLYTKLDLVLKSFTSHICI